MVDGNQNRTLTLVPACNDGATSYDVATDYDPGTGQYTPVHTFSSTDPLNTTVATAAHWVRSVNGNGASAWLRCDSDRKIAFIDTVTPVDHRRPGAAAAVGLAGNGATPTGPGYRTFAGQDDDVVVVSATNTAGLAPDGQQGAAGRIQVDSALTSRPHR